MKSTRRQFLQTSALTTVAGAIPASSSFSAPSEDGQIDAFQVARQHLIVRDVPGPNFFEGALLGNGDVGVCAVVRPDALGLHLGKSDSWDIRVSEGIEKYILNFQDLLKLWQRASDEAKRLGKPDMLDLEWFKQQVRYCILPDRIANDRIRQTGGRYNDSTNFDFMMRMGVWTENLSLPGVLNECMLQSYTGTIRLFPSTRNLGPARFQNLRAAGAFLVSASHNGNQVTCVRILSEKGRELRIAQPWPGYGIHVTRGRDGKPISIHEGKGVFTFPTDPGHEYHITRA